MTSNAPKDQLPILFRPEFLNRVDEIITFHSLSEGQLKQIIEIQLNGLRARLAERHIEITLSDAAREHLVRVGYDPAYGARPLKRVFQREILNELSKQILAGKVNRDAVIYVDLRNETDFVFENAKSQEAVVG